MAGAVPFTAMFPTWPDDADLVAAAAAELRRRHPSKRHLAPTAHDIVAEVRRAWSCWHAGAELALFDVLGFFDTVALRVPAEVAHPRDDLIAVGLGCLAGAAEKEGVGQGERGCLTPWNRHLAALRRRLRAETVASLLRAAELRAYTDDLIAAEVERGLIDRAAWENDRATRPEVPGTVRRACELALMRLGQQHTTWRAAHHDLVAIERARREPGWPGVFYIPGEAVAERFAIEPALALIPLVGSDAPSWAVV
jgi:hypothetical protein